MKYFLFQSFLLCLLKGPRRTLTMLLTASNWSLTPNNQVLASNNLHLASINLDPASNNLDPASNNPDPASNNLDPASNNLGPASKIQSGRRCWRKDRGITVNELPLIFTIWSRYVQGYPQRMRLQRRLHGILPAVFSKSFSISLNYHEDTKWDLEN